MVIAVIDEVKNSDASTDVNDSIEDVNDFLVTASAAAAGDNVPVFSYLKNGERLSCISGNKRPNWRGFRLRDVLNDERKMQN